MDLIAKENLIIKAKAKALFFATSYSPQKISMMSGADEEKVLEWIFGRRDSSVPHTHNKECWFYKKEVEGVNVIGSELFREVEPMLISATKATTIKILTKQLELLAEKYGDETSTEEMEVDQIRKVVDMFQSIDKIDRLEQGRATNITETRLDRMDATDIVAERRRRSDYIDVEYKEIDDE